MTRGRKPKPTGLKLRHGNPGRHALNMGEAKPLCGLPEPPVFLDWRAKAEWKRAGRELELYGLITSIDMAAFAAYCQAFSWWWKASEKVKRLQFVTTTPNGYAAMNTWMMIANRQRLEVSRFCVEFGMTPSSRSRAAVSKRKNDDEADGKKRFFNTKQSG